MNDKRESIRPIDNQASNQNLSFIHGRDPSILSYAQQPLPQETIKKDLNSLYEDEMQASTSDSSSLPSTFTEQDLSFIRGRDPSILSYGQQPLPQETIKKDLNSLYENEMQASTSDSSTLPSIFTLGDTINVYLRLRPFPENMKVSEQQKEAYKIINANTLLTKLPSIDKTSNSLKGIGASATILRKFTFTHTFGPETTQLQLFEQAVERQLHEFLNGRSGTVMSYGTTNAGKSYTLQGTKVSPGIIPRALEYIFSNINPRPTPCYKPLHNIDVINLDAGATAYEMELKTRLLGLASIDKNQCMQTYRSMQQLVQDGLLMKPSKTGKASYSVWVSFAEIYNETIFDLLSYDCQRKRPSLKLVTDNNGKAFIKDLKVVCINSGSEAYQLLMAGQHNLKIATTALNTRSSRSHCIFTIKVLKYFKENSPNDVEVSTFSFCDLAGSERLKKTLNAGERLKEAQSINTSLLVLGRCLKSIFDSQSAKSKHKVIGPFRESKLTRLFQSALSGKEHITLIVNISPVPNLYNETQNVLNFSAIAKEIVFEPVIHKRRVSSSRFSQIVSQSIMTVTDWDMTELKSTVEEQSSRATESFVYVHIEDYDEVVQENEKLKKEVAQLKSAALNSDFEIRQEMSDTYTAMINKLEANFKNRLQDVEKQQADLLEWSVKHVEDYYEEKLDMLSSRSRKRSRIDDSDDKIDIEESDDENVQLMEKIESLKKSVKKLRESNKELLIKDNANSFELSLIKKDLRNCNNLLHAAQSDIGCGDQAEKLIEELRTQLIASKKQIKSLKVYLNEAKEEFIRMTGVEAGLEKCVKKKDEQLVELMETITDLTEQLENTSLCLAERTKTVETLEEKLDIYAKNLATAKKGLQNSEDQLKATTVDYLVSLKEIEELRKDLAEEISRGKISADECNCEEQVKELEKLKKELTQMKVNAEELNAKIATKDKAIDEKEDLLKLITNELRISQTELAKATQKLEATKSEKKILQNKILESEKIAETLQRDLVEDLNRIRENSERSTEQENQISKLEKDVSVAKERLLIKDQLLDAHVERILKLEKDIADTVYLREKLPALENELKICEDKKGKLETQLGENRGNIMSLEKKLQASMIKEQDQQNEIITLQKEIKRMIQMSANDSRGDIEMKQEVRKMLRKLTAAQNALVDSEAASKVREKAFQEKIALLKMQVEACGQGQAEDNQLQTLNEGLNREIEQKNEEILSFNENRDDTVQRYEYNNQVLRHTGPLKKSKRDLKESRSMREEAVSINISEDENLPISSRRGRNIEPVFTANDVSVINLSASELRLSTVPSVK